MFLPARQRNVWSSIGLRDHLHGLYAREEREVAISTKHVEAHEEGSPVLEDWPRTLCALDSHQQPMHMDVPPLHTPLSKSGGR